MAKFFTEDEVWLGGFYELALEFAAGKPKDALDLGLKTIWNGLDGCYLRADVEPSQQPRVEPSWLMLETHGHLRGGARLPDGKRVVCGTCSVQEENGAAWIVFYIPMGALESVYRISYPIGAESKQWREPLESWLADLGQRVFAVADFLLGLIGEEVSGTVSAQELEKTGVPSERSIGYLWPERGRSIWYPTNRWSLETPIAS